MDVKQYTYFIVWLLKKNALVTPIHIGMLLWIVNELNFMNFKLQTILTKKLLLSFWYSTICVSYFISCHKLVIFNETQCFFCGINIGNDRRPILIFSKCQLTCAEIGPSENKTRGYTPIFFPSATRNTTNTCLLCVVSQ